MTSSRLRVGLWGCRGEEQPERRAGGSHPPTKASAGPTPGRNAPYEDEFPSTSRDLIMIQLKFTNKVAKGRREFILVDLTVVGSAGGPSNWLV